MERSWVRKSVLTEFEAEMLERSAPKVKDSAAAAQFHIPNSCSTRAMSRKDLLRKKTSNEKNKTSSISA
jgi:hypothetical protein